MNRKYTSWLLIFFLIGSVLGGMFFVFDNDAIVSAGDITVGAVGADYTTIQSAINNSNNGDTVYVWAGTYYENVIVNRTLTIIGNSSDTIVNGGGSGDVFTITYNGCTIKDLTIFNGDRGVYASNKDFLTVNNTYILGCPDGGVYFSQADDCVVENNIITGTIDTSAIFSSIGDRVIICNNTISDLLLSGSKAIFVAASTDSIIYNNTISTISGVGIFIQDSNVIVYNNSVNACGIVGIYLDTVDNSTFYNNTIICLSGIHLYDNSVDIVLYNNHFDNTNNVLDDTSNNIWNTSKTLGTNIVNGSYLGGNYWSDYTGVDADHDGIGDTSYSIYDMWGSISAYDYLPLIYGTTTTINVYNESSPYIGVTDWSYKIYSSTETFYTAHNQNNPVVINNIPFLGEEVYFQINATGYDTRTYFIDVERGTNYILNAYLPPATANLYYIQVLNELDYPITNVGITITKQVAGNYNEMASGFTNINGMFPVYLIGGDLYSINLSKTGYATLIMQSCMADPTYYGYNYPIIYYLNSSSEPFDVVGFNNVILFCSESGWDTSNDTLHISFFDKLSETSDITIQVYESYETNLSFNFSYSYTDTYDIDIWASGLNTSRMHRIKIISMNHTTLGHITNKSCDIYPIHLADDAVNETALEDAFSDVGGDFSMGYVNMIILFIPSIAILIGLGKADPGFGVLVAGMYFILCSWHIDLIEATTIAVLISMLIPLGIITIAGKRGKKIT